MYCKRDLFHSLFATECIRRQTTTDYERAAVSDGELLLLRQRLLLRLPHTIHQLSELCEEAAAQVRVC